MTDRFPICLPFVLKQEMNVYTGTAADWANVLNFDNNKHDPGGRTQCGIIQREYDVWRRAHGLPMQDVRKITVGEGTGIYRVLYWQPHCPFLAPGLDLCFFDSAVNAGPTEATKILQVALGLKDDGNWGPATAAAATLSRNNTQTHIERFTARRLEVYEMMPGFKWFGKDWTRRTKEIGEAAFNMAQGGFDV